MVIVEFPGLQLYFRIVCCFCVSIILPSPSSDENKPIWMHAEEREECKVRPL